MKPKDVDEFIKNAPKDLQPKLKKLRATIKTAAPEAKEGISYGMPYYHYKGRLVYFNLWKDHIGLYGAIESVIEDHKNELKGYVTSKGTIQFPLDKKLPLGLIKKLVKAQTMKNDEAKKGKQK